MHFFYSCCYTMQFFLLTLLYHAFFFLSMQWYHVPSILVKTKELATLLELDRHVHVHLLTPELTVRHVSWHFVWRKSWCRYFYKDSMNSMKFRFILFLKNTLQTILWRHNAKVNSHQRWKQTRIRVCFHLWCELTRTMNMMELQLHKSYLVKCTSC